MTNTIPSIEVRGVSKRFGSVTALDNVSFSVQPGEMFFLLGPSGCGKTTLLRILAGLETPDSGTILFGGKDVALLPPHERGAPMVFQNYALWPHLNVRDNVAFGLVERRVPRADIAARVADVLQRVGLAGLSERMPGQLSGGQQQRVVLARALVLNPAIILLDEPLSNLDAKLRVEMREEIEKLHAALDLTFIYVTHDQADALSLADRMAVLSAGKVSAVGTPLDLYRCPPNAFCANFLGEANLIEGQAANGKREGDDGRVALQTPLGLWRGVSAEESRVLLQPGQGVLCLVRPENVQPVRELSAALNVFEAEITGLRMNGPTVTVTLAAGEGHAAGAAGAGLSLRATVLTHDSLGLCKGQRSRWGVAQSNTILIAQA
jgi:iron(III) transport system ATP-binding protein